ncbi:MAG: MFS transporter [Spirochaetaceae bacterium]
MKGSGDKLSLTTKLGFGVGDLGGNLFFTIVGFYLLFFLTEVAGLSAAVAGIALMIGKIWDAVTDPIVGYLSDRTHTRLGRRRPYMLWGSVALFLLMVAAFTVPELPPPWKLVYVILALCLVNTAWTLVNIPYGALTPELTRDFHERTALNGYRMSFAVIGTFIGAAAVLPLVSLFGGSATSGAGWSAMAVVMGGVMLLSGVITVLAVTERYQETTSVPEQALRSYLAVLKLKEFRTILIPWSLHVTGINVIQASLLYYFAVIFGSEEGFQVALPILLAAAITCIPVWVQISKRIGKKRSYNIGMAIFAAAVVVFFFIGHRMPIEISYILMAVAGTGFAAHYVMPFAMIPDVVEFDAITNGKRREGVFYGLWTFVAKIGQALGLGLNGLLLTVAGYQQGGATQSDSAVLAIRLLVGPIPALLFVTAILVLLGYPITEEVYEKLIAGDNGGQTDVVG